MPLAQDGDDRHRRHARDGRRNRPRRCAFACLPRLPSLYDTWLTRPTWLARRAVWTLALLHRNRACIRQLSRDGRGVDVSLVLRVCVFGVYVFLGLWCAPALLPLLRRGLTPDVREKSECVLDIQLDKCTSGSLGSSGRR